MTPPWKQLILAAPSSGGPSPYNWHAMHRSPFVGDALDTAEEARQLVRDPIEVLWREDILEAHPVYRKVTGTLRRLSLGLFPIPFTLEPQVRTIGYEQYPFEGRPVEIQVSLHARDREIGEPVHVVWKVPCLFWEYNSEARHVIQLVRHTLHKMLHHEMDEWLTHDGEQVHNSHQGEKNPVSDEEGVA